MRGVILDLYIMIFAEEKRISQSPLLKAHN